MLSFKWFKLWACAQTNWVDFVRMEFFSCFLKDLIIIGLIHKSNVCTFQSKIIKRTSISLLPKPRTRVYGDIPCICLKAPCLLRLCASFIEVILYWIFIFYSLPLLFFKWLWSFVFTLLLFQVTQFLLAPSQSTLISGITEDMNAYVVISPFSYIYYHSILCFLFLTSIPLYVLQRSTTTYCPFHVGIICWPLDYAILTTEDFSTWL